MSIVVRPGQFRGEPHPAGKLATTLLSVTVAGMADPPRFRRGKHYATEGAVTRLEVSTGTLRAWVQGSRPEPYEAIVTTELVDRPTIGSADSLRPLLSRLTPDAADLLTSCSCPDWDDPCKHAVAALLALADELTTRPELLVEWRCHPVDGPVERVRVGSRASGRHLRIAPPPPPSSAPVGDRFATPEWQVFLGAPPSGGAPEVPREPAPVGRAMLGTVDVGNWIRSALDVLVDL